VPTEGHFVISLNYTSAGKSGNIVKNFAAGLPLKYEPGAAADTLARSARDTGGELYISRDVEDLATTLQSRCGVQSITWQWSLRKWWPLALVLPLLFALEWLILRLFAESA
jgi:hypothetical protein